MWYATVGVLVAAAMVAPPGAAQHASAQQPETYAQTVQRIKDWNKHGDDDKRLGRLFADGDRIRTNLLVACKDSNGDVAVSAARLLQTIGGEEARECLERDSVIRATADGLTEQDFAELERVFGAEPCKGANCPKVPDIDDSLIYALVIHGSPRAQAMLRRLHTLYGRYMYRTFPAQTLEATLSLVSAAAQASRRLGTPSAEQVVATAFFVDAPAKRLATADFLGRSRNGERRLFRVSHNCGGLCGAGYLVVLRKDGKTWRYALVTLEWIS